MTDECQWCGTEDPDIAFVTYQADPNDGQMETDWFENLPLKVYGMVCTTCGGPTGFIDPREDDDLPDFEELGPGTSAGREYRIDDELK